MRHKHFDPPSAQPMVAHDAHRIAPYLLRFYASISNPNAGVLTEAIMETLTNQIVWPRGALARAAAVAKKHGKSTPHCRNDDAYGLLVESNNDPIDLQVLPANPVDQKLAMLGDFKTGLKLLYVDDPTWLRAVLNLTLLEAQARQDKADGLIWTRLQQVGEVFGWSPVELQLARIAMHASELPDFADWLDTLPNVQRDAARAYKRVLGGDAAVLRSCTQPGSALANSGLFIVDRPHNGPLGLSDPPHLNSKLMTALAMPDFEVGQLARFLFQKSPASTLCDDDFAHLKGEHEPLQKLLQRATHEGERGINLLIYGPPGTGKTEFARWLASKTNLSALEVPATETDNEHGATHALADRLDLLRSAHFLLRGVADTALIFDEAEDAFPHEMPMWLSGPGGRGSLQGPRKGWVNQLLEQAPLPTIWISNAVRQMDPAFLRRFTYHLEMRRPSLRVRERIAEKRATAHGMASSAALPLAAFADASPAALDSALRFARLACIDECPTTRATTQSQLATRGLRAGLHAAGLDANGQSRQQATVYDPEFTNLRGVSATPLVQSLRRCRASNRCFFGVPGTGKTSFAEHVARELDRPLLVKRASDLQSMWLGETEKRIREAFAEAQSEDAILLLDEADSFLGDRTNAHHSWERSQVNELLQCMERFEGIFIAATNMIDTLDKAALRRFTYKIEFLPLNAEQRVAMFRRQIDKRHEPTVPVADDVRKRLEKMDGLTAGDYVVVARQAALRSDAMQSDEILEMLEAELRLREPTRGRTLGFA